MNLLVKMGIQRLKSVYFKFLPLMSKFYLRSMVKPIRQIIQREKFEKRALSKH